MFFQLASKRQIKDKPITNPHMISAVLFDLIKGLKVNHKHKTHTTINQKTKFKTTIKAP